MDNNGVGGENSMITQSSDLDNLSNLLINSYEDDAAALDQYESELEQNLQENLILEKEQSNQRLFQTFQTSACAVAQMFKDKSTPGSQNSVMSSWESFQNAAGAITVLYKDSLEACRIHTDLGIHLGQQRKMKDIINWIKKKKKRSIRKDELISFLIGKQYPSQNQMFNLFNHPTTNSNPFNSNLSSMNSSSINVDRTQHVASAGGFLVPTQNRHRAQQIRSQRNNTLVSTQTSQNTNNMTNNNTIHTNNNTNNNLINNANNNMSNNSNVNNINNAHGNGATSVNPTINQLNLINNGDNSNGSEVETNSDLATFREALIMHNRTRDTPMNPRTHTTTNHHHQNNQHNNHNTHNHSHSHHNREHNCDDLDCFFCEQIATHIEHKRSSAQLNFDSDSPTRKRSRFY